MDRKLRLILFGFVLTVLLPAAALANEFATPSPIWRDAALGEPDSELDRVSRAYVRLANEARPAVVQIRVVPQSDLKTGFKAQQPQGSRGSGFIIHPAGYVLTAQHVIDKANEIEIRLADLQRLPAKLVAADSQVDLALLKIDVERELPVLPLGDSDTIRVGELAVIFGYPFGRESSMNLGIISRPGRTYQDSAGYEMIQTDAGAYAGGSGGPLLNGRGHVIGMITMASERGSMGFATPINAIKRVVPRLMTGQKLVWGWLGVQMAEVSLNQAKSLGLSPVKGVLVDSVLPGQSAEQGGIRSQDIILSVNDMQVNSPRDVLRMIGGLEAGRVVKLTILRKGQTLQLSVPLGKKPESPKEVEG
ncbi:MAG TPA: trypsin-like peptidase domain-containing protein [Candidatus Binatia bacterium]|nr:trypsin-like peptidase domain-containing protein [Candidatus Binatia bacterium]